MENCQAAGLVNRTSTIRLTGFALPGYPEIGVANGSSWIWMTYDAGHSWTQVPLS
jgi:hypothetical protein